jgi:hypothetical protein
MRARTRAVIAALVVVANVDLSAQSLDRRVIRGAQLETAGASRLADIVDLIGVSRSSVDGLTYAISGDGLPGAGVSAPGTPRILVLVDGVPVPVGVLGQTLLEWLPITTGDIDSVVVTRGPAVVAGLAAPRGAIELFRRRAVAGAFTRAAYQFGDESGDPGPFRYTDQRSPNVEKVGPFAQMAVGYGSPRWSAEAAYGKQTFNNSDSLIRARLPSGALTANRQYSELRTVAGRLGLHVVGDHDVVVSRTTHIGLLFVPALGVEQPIDAAILSASASGHGSRGSLNASYRLSASAADLGGFESVIPMRVGHERAVLFGAVDVVRQTRRSAFTLGVSGGRQIVELDTAPRRISHEWERAQLAATFGSVTGSHATIGAGVTIAGRASVDQRASVTWAMTSKAGVTASIVAMPHVAESDDARAERAILGVADAEAPDLVRMALGLAYRGPVRIEVTTHLDRSSGWGVLTEPAPYAGTNSVSRAAMRGNAAILGGSLVASTPEGRPLSASGDFRWTAVQSGSDAMRRALESVPTHELRVGVRAVPFSSVRFAADVSIVGPTRWTSVDSTATSQRTPPIERLDLSAEKWVWDRRIRVQALFRNVFNRPERYHPLSAQWNRRTFLSASLAIPRLD